MFQETKTGIGNYELVPPMKNDQTYKPTGTLEHESGHFRPYEKRYRGLMIDRDLDKAVMDRLNAIPGIIVIGTCAGHPETDMKPGFLVDVGTGHTAEDIAERLANSVRSDDTDVETMYWGGPFGIEVTHINGRPELDKFSPAQIAACPTRKAIVYVNSKIDNTGTNQAQLNAWWATAIDRLESAARLQRRAVRRSLKTARNRT